MKALNKVTLIGNLGQDPETRAAGSTNVTNIRIATNESYKDREGNLVEKTEWHSVVAFAQLADIMQQILTKGDKVYIEGSLQTRQWEDKEGNTRYTTEVKARDMIKLSERSDGGGGAKPEPARKSTRTAAGRAVPAGDDFGDDSLPF